MKKLLLATGNPHKAQEFRELLGSEVEIYTLKDLNLPSAIEDGKTFAENALIKAIAGAKASGLLTVADDSGLEVTALGGAPGVWSARYAGEGAGDLANNQLLLQRLQGVSQRDACFRCAIAIATPQGWHEVVEGSCQGEILTQPQGMGGFGYDPLFWVAEFGGTFAQLAGEVKNRISHRAQALKMALPLIERGLSQCE